MPSKPAKGKARVHRTASGKKVSYGQKGAKVRPSSKKGTPTVQDQPVSSSRTRRQPRTLTPSPSVQEALEVLWIEV